MRWPTAAELGFLAQTERNFSKLFLGIQKGKERTSDAPPPLMAGHHYALVAGDVYNADEHTLTFGVANFLLATDIHSGMTLGVGTLTEPFRHGSVRIREVDIANNRLNLEPNNLSAEGYLIAGDIVWCDGIYRLYRKLPYITGGTIYEDGNGDTLLAAAGIPGYGIAFGANYLDRPCALMGSPRIAWTNEYIDFYGWKSFGRGGNAITTYLWDSDGGETPDGVNIPGNPGTTPVRMRWPQSGEYNVTLTVTDNSGKAGNDAYGVPYTQHVAVRPVLVYDKPGEGPNVPYSDFNIESLDGKYGSGWSVKIEVFGTADKSEFPDNSMVILFAQDWYGGIEQSMGGWYGQENILFIGHIRADSVTVDFEKSAVSFTADTIEQWMKDVDLWPANLVSTVGAPTKWHEFQGMTVEDILWYLAEFRSNLKDVTDCFFCSDLDGAKQVDFLDLTEASLYDQMSEQIGSCFFGELSASRVSSVHLYKHKNMLDVIERTYFGAPIFWFQRRDWLDELDIGEERMRNSVAQVDFIGFVYDTNGNPMEVYSLAPERQDNFGLIEKITGVLLSGSSIVAAQPEANTLSGLYLAWKNIRFPHVRISAPNNRFLEPATQDYFAVSLSDTIRGLEWEEKEFITIGASYKFDSEHGVFLVEYEGEESVWGPDGVSGDYPDGPVSPVEPDEPPDYWPPPTPDPPPQGGGVCQNAAVCFDAGGGVWFTYTRGVTWINRSAGLPSNNVLDLIWDPWWFTAHRSGGHDPDDVILWASGLGFIAVSNDAGRTWANRTPSTNPPNSWGDAIPPTATTVTYKQLHGCIHNLNTFYVLVEWQEAGGAWRGWLAKTINNGVSWTWQEVAPFTKIGSYYYASAWSLISGFQFEYDTWALCIAQTNGWGYEDEGLAVDTDLTTYGQFFRGGTFAQYGSIHWAMHFGIGFTRVAGIIPVEIRIKLCAVDGVSANLASECRLWPDQNPNTWVAGAHDYVFPGVDPVGVNTLTPGPVIDRTVNCTNHDITEYVGFRVGGFNLDTNVYLAFARIHENYVTLGAAETKPLAMDVDTDGGSRLYLTTWMDGNLYVEARNTSDLSLIRRYVLGASTIAQVANKTYWVAPRCPHVPGPARFRDHVWVFGRYNDGAERHIAKSEDACVTFTNRDGDSGWDANHRLGGIVVLYNGDTVYAFVNHAATPRLWQSLNQGTNWANLNSMPVNVEFDAAYNSTYDFIIGSNVAGAQMAAALVDPYTGAWENITDGLPVASGAAPAIVWVY